MNIKSIHDKADYLLAVVFISYFFAIANFICSFPYNRSNKIADLCLYCCCIEILGFVVTIVYIIFLYKLILDFYYSDINQFIKFLECRNVIKEEFSKYLFVEDLYYHIVFFIISSIAYLGFNLKDNNNEKRRQRNNNDYEFENLN